MNFVVSTPNNTVQSKESAFILLQLRGFLIHVKYLNIILIKN